jgi:hypothetical protein
MKLKETTLERIISNENTVSKLESMYSTLRLEIDGGGRNYCATSYQCKKYNIDIASLLSGVIGALHKLNSLDK